MKDYRVEVRVKNNYLWTLMRTKNLTSVAALARATGLYASTLSNIINLKIPAQTNDGKWRKPILVLARYFGVAPDAIVPPQHVADPLVTNRGAFEADIEQLASLSATPSYPSIEDQTAARQVETALHEALATFPPRTRRIMSARWGLGGMEKKTFKEIGAELGISGDRVNQIEHKTMRQLNHPSLKRPLREALVGDADYDAVRRLGFPSLSPGEEGG